MSVVVEQETPEIQKGPTVNVVGQGYACGAPIPWFVKMWLKITLAYFPVPYDIWKKLGMFEHGDVIKQLPNLYNSFDEHIQFYKERMGEAPNYCLELGPGDSVGHALCAAAEGMRGIVLVDAGDFASKDEEHYSSFYNYLRSDKKVSFSKVLLDFDRDSVLEFADGQYLTNGLKDMPQVSDNHIDFSYSHAVFEHIYRDEFGPYMKELFRVQKPGSLARHWVDLHDHLGGALNSMRFSSDFWEGKAVKQAGFYTNRLTMDEMIKLAEDAGFGVEIQRINKWDSLPTPRKSMHKMFQDKSEEELNVCTFLMIMEKP